ncbi:MAG: acetylxylan esterase [Candidatus Latescibacterota bacterium]
MPPFTRRLHHARPDVTLPDDARLYAFRHYRSVFPLPEWGDLGQWRRQRRRIRDHLWRCTGLNARTAAFRARGRVVKTFEHEGLVVENLCIEALPGLYLTGNLYRPAQARGRLPLVLNPHGHAMCARTVPLDLYSVPHRAMNQALQGLAAFAYSMIGYDEDTRQLEHGTLLRGAEKRVCNALGLSMFGLQLNNSIKALDYLCSRDDIDPRRIGCTGESGGGTQTYFLAAIDERVGVVAPAVMLSGHFQGGCVCENAPLLHLSYSNLQYAALIAPRPLLLLGCTGDWTHHLREREYPCLRALYRLYDREEALDLFYQDEAHNYDRASRERVYAWMVRWLLDQPDTPRRLRESSKPVPSTPQLLVYDQPVPPYKGAIRSQAELIRTWQGLHREPAAPAEAAAVLGLSIPARDDLLVRDQTPRHAFRQRHGFSAIHYGRFCEDSGLQCRFVVPEKGRPAYLLLRGWQDGAQWQQFVASPPELVGRLIAEGCGILLPLLFGQAAAPELKECRRTLEDSYLYTTYNRTPHMHQAGDVLTTVRLAELELGVPPPSLAVVAEADVGLIALAAWAFANTELETGPLAADLGGADLADPETWARQAYFPLLAGAGGVRALAGMCGRRRAHLSGVPAACQRLLPRSFRVTEECRDLAGLLQAVARP